MSRSTLFWLFTVFIWVDVNSFANLLFPKKPEGHHHHQQETEKSLVLIHVLFRHGNRTADSAAELYPKDPYLNETYFPFGLGQLTNAGKVREYAIGTVLRERYNAFLGDYYYPRIIDAWTTDYNRTKMSLELVLASLFPPRREEIWNRQLNWQPVPYNYLKRSEDKVLLGVLCPYYEYLYNINKQSYKQQAEFQKYQEEFKYISKNSGLNVSSFLQVYNVFFGMSTEVEWGFKLPAWTQKVWPDVITKLAIQEYFSATGTTDLTKLASGYFIQKVIQDTQNKIANIQEKNDRKIHMYSAHENNLAELLILLNVFEPPHIPTYGSYIVFEVHNINNTYGVKIYYENYTTNKPQLLKLPACDTFCPLDKFTSLLEEYFPTDDMCNKVPDSDIIYFQD